MREINNSKRRAVLNMMANGFNAQGSTAVIVEKGADYALCDILSVVHEGIKTKSGEAVRGRYYFPEYDFAADNVQYLTCAIELSGPLSAKEAEKANAICGQVNPELPCGAYMVYKDLGLVYNLSVPISESLDEGDLFEQVNITIGNAIAMAGAYAERFI